MTAPNCVRAPSTGHDPAVGDDAEVVLVVTGVGELVALTEVVRCGGLGVGLVDVVCVVDLELVVGLATFVGVGLVVGVGLMVGVGLVVGVGVGVGDGLGAGFGEGRSAGPGVGTVALFGNGSEEISADVGASAKEIGSGDEVDDAGGSAVEERVVTTAGPARTCCRRWINTPTRTPSVTATTTADAIPSAHRCRTLDFPSDRSMSLPPVGEPRSPTSCPWSDRPRSAIREAWLVGALCQAGGMKEQASSPPVLGGLPQYPGAQALVTDGQALLLRGLTKEYGGHAVVDHIDLDVPGGSFFGLVGPNGAGKTTTLSMITGLLRPDAGRVVLAGIDVWQEPVRAKAAMGVLPDGLRLFERLSGPELLSYLGRLRGLDAATVNERAGELLHVLDLAEAGQKLVADYSTGMRKKITLAAALLHSPPVLLLDEPLEAVDPVSARVIRTVLTRYTAAGGTVVFSSHVMALVEELCSHVAVMSHGRIVASGDLAAVRGSARSLDDAFLHLVGADDVGKGGLSWLGSSRA